MFDKKKDDDRDPRAGSTVTLKVRTPLAQRVRAGFVFGREWQRVDVSREVARRIEEDPELAVAPLSVDDEEVPVAASAGPAGNLQTAPTRDTRAEARQARERLDQRLAAVDAEADAKASLGSPPEGPKGGGARGDARKA